MTTTTSTLVTNIYKSRKNILDILEEQGFLVDDYKGFSINEVNSMTVTNQLDMLIETNSEINKKCYIKYFLDKSLRPNNIHEFIEDLFTLEKVLETKDDLIIIVKDKPNDSLINTVRDIWEQENINIIIFGIQHLLFNILEHSYVPKHRVISKEEQLALFERLNITTPEELPEISRFDPVAKAIGLRPEQICHIERKSPTAFKADFYRYCVA